MQPDAVAVLYVDDALIALNKPSGLLAVPGKGPDKQDCLSARVQALYPDALVVHRLDMATSGLMVMARTPQAQRTLSAAFERRLVHKRYEAIVNGELQTSPDTWREIDLPIAVDWPNRPLRTINMTDGQASCTRVQTMHYDPAQNCTRVALEPVTGRTHQLRVHLLAIGHPILGDALYAPPSVQTQAARLLLHACTLELPHPQSGHSLHLNCPAEF